MYHAQNNFIVIGRNDSVYLEKIAREKKYSTRTINTLQPLFLEYID